MMAQSIRKRGTAPNIYALYNGDVFLDVGTAEEIAERRGLKKETILFYCHSKRRADKKRRKYIVIKLDDEED